MGRAHGQGRSSIALGMVLAGMLLARRPCAFALDPALDISQYAHTAWKVREGFTKGTIASIAQTPDGYLWLGTEFGLLRFDGVRNVPWQPPPDQHLASSDIASLLAAGDGTLWIGTYKGLASWKSGKLTQYPELAGRIVYVLLEDREGAVWAGGLGFFPPGRLCAIQNGNVRCYGEDGSLGYGVFGLYEDSEGSLWAGVEDGLWRWKPGPPEFYPLPGEPDGIQALGEDAEGALLVGWKGGIHRFVDRKIEAYPLQDTAQQFRARRILRDRDGSLWIGTSDRGLLHVHQGRTDVFSPSDGLSGEHVYTLFEDREGSIWVATANGFDRFRDFAVASFSVKQGLSNATVGSVLADKEGSVWLATFGGLNRWNNGQITIPRTGSVKRDGKLNGLHPNSLFQDGRGRIWASTLREFGYVENDRFVPVSGIPGGSVQAIAEDKAGNLWIANQELGLFRLSLRSEVQQIPWASLGHKDSASALAADPVLGGLWLGFALGGIAYFTDGQVRASCSAADGLGEGRVNGLQFDHEGTLWAATEGGLSRLKNGRVATLTSKNGLPCDTVHWSMEDDDHSSWLYMPCGLVRVARPELDAWAAAVDRDKDTKRMVQAPVFDSPDGVRSLASARYFSPQVAKSSDGRIWFLPWDGASVVDPHHLPFNKLPPPVHIDQITADHKTYGVSSVEAPFRAASPAKAGLYNGPLPLPPLVRDLEIDYTALSFVAPEKVLFRYKLEGWDRDWQDAGNRRQAFYTNLSPRNYRFRVRACNNSGVWNESGASFDFSIAPAYYQTTWFRLSCVAVFLALLWSLYELRRRQLQRQFNAGLEARVNERTRIARELHDTLLQSFQGLLLKFQVVSDRLADGPAKQDLESAINDAAEAITEGRDAVQDLRLSTVTTNDLAGAISALGQELATNQTSNGSPLFHVEVEGTPRNLHPILRDEVYRIAAEALRNAFRHAQARRIESEILYEERQLRLRVRDDGKGLDPALLRGEGRPGHYGLRGMRERATLIGARLEVWSKLHSGTEVELTVPASRAYAASRAASAPRKSECDGGPP